MRRLTHFVLGLGMCLAPALAAAHETIPQDWCPKGTRVVIIDSFSFSPAELAAYREVESARRDDQCTQGAKTCGIVDDWFWAREMSSGFCAGLGLRRWPVEDAVAFVERPASFLASDHHQRYRFDEGPLSGQCVVCRALEPLPARPLPRGR